MVTTRPPGWPGTRAPVLEYDGVGFGFHADPHGLFHGVNLAVGRGEVVAIIGDNGSGKSTLLRMPLGLAAPRTGRVLFNGSELSAADHVPKLGFVGALPQVDGALPLPPELPVPLFRRTVTDAVAAAGGDTAFARKVADALNLDSHEAAGKRFGQLSKGLQCRHLWWLALAKPVDLLLLDEPFDGLDTDIKPKAEKLLREVIAARRTAVLIVSHHAHEIAPIADRIYVLEGKTLRPRGDAGYHAVVTTGDDSTPYRGLTAREFVNVVAEAVLGREPGEVVVVATVAVGEKGGA